MQVVPREVALKDKAAHAFRYGVGYVALGRPRPVAGGLPPCRPPAPCAPGSLHALRSPGGKLTALRWDGTVWEHAHHPGAGNRMGWTPEYLCSAGWVYAQPVENPV